MGGGPCSNAESDVNVSDSTTSNSVWSPYALTDSNLLKLPFTVNNPGIRLPTNGQYENELSYFQLYFTDDIITEFVHETNRYVKEKIEKAQLLGKHSIWRTWKDTTLEEMKAFLGVVKAFQKNLVQQLVERIQNKNTRKHGRNSITEASVRRHRRHFIEKIPNGKAKDCAVCSNRKVICIQTVYH